MIRDRRFDPVLHRGPVYTHLTGAGWLNDDDGAIAVSEVGRIEAVGRFDSLAGRFPGRRVIDHRPHLLIPGLVDCHQHLCHYSWTRLVPDLRGWLKQIYPLELAFQDAGYAERAARRFFSDLIRNGTTTCCVHGPYFAEATEAAFKAAEGAGLRVILGMNAGDRDLPAPLLRPASRSTGDAIELHRTWDGVAGGRLAYAFTVRPAYCSSADLLWRTATAARDRGARIQCHLAEDTAGTEAILGLFPDCGTEAEVYERHGLLGPKTVMAHGVYLDDVGRGRLAVSGTSVAHCPRANLLAGGRQMDLGRLLGSGIRVGLGSDLGAGKGLSLFRVMEDAMKVTPGQTVHDVFRRATLEGAAALGLADRVGSLEAGKEADFLATCPRDVNDFPGAPPAELDDWLSSLIFRGDSRVVREVYVGGRLLRPGETNHDS